MTCRRVRKARGRAVQVTPPGPSLCPCLPGSSCAHTVGPLKPPLQGDQRGPHLAGQQPP